MKSSDDKTNSELPLNNVDTEAANATAGDQDGFTVPSDANKDKRADVVSVVEDRGIGDIVSFAVKTVAVVLSLIIMLTCIIAVGLPLQTMRIFNKLGMSARAVDFGERYIENRLDDHAAAQTDALGNYTVVSHTSELTDDDMIEALYVCTNLSYKLMEESYSGYDYALGEYYARRVEKYTRIYLSLNGVSAVNDKKSSANIAAMPLLAMRPAVYSYGNAMRNMNYRARTYLGETNTIAYNSRSNDRGSMTELIAQSNSFAGRQPETRDATIALLDDFVDYVTQLGEYLDVAFIGASVVNDVYAYRYLDGLGEVAVVSEVYVGEKYGKVLKGREFGIFVNNTNGFTTVYNSLVRRFDDYIKMAVEFKPDDHAGNKLDEQLHQLYWLQALDKAARRFWYMDFLLYHNREAYGAGAEYIINGFNRHNGIQNNNVFGSAVATIGTVYSALMKTYLETYQQA